MKKIMSMLAALCMAVSAMGQITAPVVEEKPDTDQKYMVGAVPEVDGRVVLSRTIEMAQDLTLDEAMKRVDTWMERIAKDERTLYQKRLPQSSDHELQNTYMLELTFSKSFLSHDFANISYVLAVRIEGQKAVMEMSRITYKYNENNKANKYSAEEMISDKYALNKKKDKMVFGYKKFRMKTIDLMDELEASLRKELGER